MEQFFEYIGLLLKSLSTAIQVPFQIFGSSITVFAFMPALISTACIIVLSFGLIKLVVGWI